jgi:hypothetical protein
VLPLVKSSGDLYGAILVMSEPRSEFDAAETAAAHD